MPACKFCGEEIEHLEYWEWRLMKTKYFGGGFAVDQKWEDEGSRYGAGFRCPKCGRILFEYLDEADKFLKGRGVEAGGAVGGEPVEFLNLTPHEVTVFDAEGKNVIMRIPPSGVIARVETISEIIGYCDAGQTKIPIRATRYGEIRGLPETKRGVIYIVSTVVLLALKAKGIKRDDVVAPDTNPDSVVRDPEGRIIGVKYFQVV
jgi:hypothetical protein